MDVYPMLCENYNGMSQSFYAQYKDAERYLKSMKCDDWDILSPATDETEKYVTAQSMRLHSAIAAIVFQALAVEAFVNLYGAQKVGDEAFYSKYDFKGATTLSKLKAICKHGRGVEDLSLDERRNLYKHFEDVYLAVRSLCKDRNGRYSEMEYLEGLRHTAAGIELHDKLHDLIIKYLSIFRKIEDYDSKVCGSGSKVPSCNEV